MPAFEMRVASVHHQARYTDVTSFVGEDESGQFGIMAGHAALVTVLIFGLARFHTAADDTWHYLALPGGTLLCADGVLSIATRSFVLSDDIDEVSQALADRRQRQWQQDADWRHNLDKLEEQLMDRLWRIKRR